MTPSPIFSSPTLGIPMPEGLFTPPPAFKNQVELRSPLEFPNCLIRNVQVTPPKGSELKWMEVDIGWKLLFILTLL